MKIPELVKHWETHESEPRTEASYEVKLSVFDAAKIKALTDMFPGRTEEQIITDLLSSALDELHERLPYRPGKNVIAEDEMGDPIYEDAGLSRKLHDLAEKHVRHLKAV